MVKDNTRRRRKHAVHVPSGANDDENDQQVLPSSRSRRTRHDDDQSFFLLFLRAAFVVAISFLVFGMMYSHFKAKYQENTFEEYEPDGLGNGEAHGQQAPNDIASTTVPNDVITAPPLPHWNLSNFAKQYDAYAVASQRRNVAKDENVLFCQMAAGLREQFSKTYGEETVARGLLDAASTNFGGGVRRTACRIQEARTNQRPFRFAFGGYSVTAGRGNLFSQSFPIVMEQKLHSIFHELGIELIVRNAAVGGCPSFPYGWCLENFWGGPPLDAVSWDFSMNEAGGDPLGFEAYLRRIMQVYSSSIPQLLMIDTSMALERRALLEKYGTHALVVHRDVAVEPFLKLEEKFRPEGFKDWRKFGAPIGAPGQSYHHPAVKEHEFIAWVLVMHFLSALELLMQSTLLMCQDDPSVRFTRPLAFANETAVAQTSSTSLFFGTSSGKNDTWTMNPVYCRTSFDPIIHGNLTSIVVAGGVGEDLDIMLPKSKMFYNLGWVLNLSEDEKKAKRSLMRFGGLGFVDSKRSYYGIFASGPISFKLSLQLPGDKTDYSNANALFRSIVVCEVNEKRDHGACEIDKDVGFTIGGVNASKPSLLDPTRFLGKPVCVLVDVPLEAKAICRDEECSLEVNATVVNRRINERKDACSISHVIWEQQDLSNILPQ